MSKTYIVEAAGKTAGIIVHGHGGFRFFSSSLAFDRLDGETFATPLHATRAAELIAARRRQQRQAS